MTARRGTRPNTTGRRGRNSCAAIRAVPAALCAAALAAAAPAPASAVAVKQGMFQSYEKRSSKIEIFSKWNGVLRRSEGEDRVAAERCRGQGGTWCTLVRWRAFLDTQRGLSPMTQIEAVNAFVNRVAYVSDQGNYGVVDRWATPREFFARGGDCEDYAVAKYLSLRALGWPQERLRIAVVMDRQKRQVHAVLAVYHEDGTYILDNQIPTVSRDDAIWHYQPVYSINEHHWWFHMVQRPASN